MRLFTDIYNGQEIFTDSFKFNYLYNEVAFEVQSSYIKKGGEVIDIGCGNAFGGEEEEKNDDQIEKVLDIVEAFKFNETSFTKGAYSKYIKEYMGKIKKHLESTKPDRVAPFMSGAKEMVGWIIKNFDEFTFYTPENWDIENSIILSYYKEDNLTPTFLILVDGLKETKI